MTAPTLITADLLPLADLHAATVAAFADYLAGPFPMTLQQYSAFIGRQGIDLALSRAAVRDGEVLSFAFVCPRPEVSRWRLAAMGALPSARGTGAAPALLDDLITRATSADIAWLELECFAENQRAQRLYRGRGFEVVCELNGWTAPEFDATQPRAPACGVRPVDRAIALSWLAEANRRIDWMPFPNTDRAQVLQSRPLTAWQCGSAQILFSAVDGTPAQIHSLIDLDPSLQDAETLAHALLVAHPNAFAPQTLRDDLGGAALKRAGFRPHAMNQLLMKRAV